MTQVGSSKQAGKAAQSAVDVDVLSELILSMRLDREQTYELVDALLRADDFEDVAAAAATDGEADQTTEEEEDNEGTSSVSRYRRTPRQEIVAPTPAPTPVPTPVPVAAAVVAPVPVPVPVAPPAPAVAPVLVPVTVPVVAPVVAPAPAPIPISVVAPIVAPVPAPVPVPVAVPLTAPVTLSIPVAPPVPVSAPLQQQTAGYTLPSGHAYLVPSPHSVGPWGTVSPWVIRVPTVSFHRVSLIQQGIQEMNEAIESGSAALL